ncbi:uncharacterized protein N7469_008107 [Penicillium citrinum]|uniref:Uncharacterized protein n=2 Tax=Penicillium TaxID=5073 RepID=A0A9W9NTY8_PENCI|nr:uncharacterized protein N7469_008107 [Penicillium citrinum]KAJ5224604.1 hypothetical protein N7469_008107 [Penicillium citrinum]KAJ5574859.1 hypothetical protein N7450_008758 [Penicillium hetheringtonii]KAK5796144.1 hypothetical protein VI817_005429 [Penicillium citrinum]
MHFKSLFVAGALFMVGASAVDCATPEIHCETSDGSPWYDDAVQATEYWKEIQDAGKDSCGDAGCAQPHGSGCHSDGGSYGTAEIVLCQDDSSSSTPQCADCRCVYSYLKPLLDQCKGANNKIGGYAHVDMGGNYINYEFVKK